MSTQAYGLSDGRQIVGRNAGTEVVIIDFRTGVYYALNGAGIELWPLLEAGSTRAAMTQSVADAYCIAAIDVEADIRAIVDSLVAEDLIRPVDTAGAPAAAALPAGRPYQPPTLDRYDDLADAFAVDPPLDIGR